MRSKAIAWTLIALIGVVFVCLFVYLSVPTPQQEPSNVKEKQELPVLESKDTASEEPNSNGPPAFAYKDEPAAHALYEKMIETMRKAESLSYKSEYRWENQGREIGSCIYTIWMKKPNHFRVETINNRGQECGTLVGDGDYLWIYWPWPHKNYSKYMKEETPLAQHSIAHKTSQLGARMGMTVIDPSTFHGYTDSLQPYLDGVRMMGTEKVGDEECNVIEVSFMKGVRVWKLWLSQRDHLPRTLEYVIHAASDIIIEERWTEVAVNIDIPAEKFAWTPPEDWQQMQRRNPEENLLKPGQRAPDFKLASANGGTIKLSDYYGKVVWLNSWKAG